jgi:SAM-dependent methyltransferase
MNSEEIAIGTNLFYKDLQVRAMPGVHEAALQSLRRFVVPERQILEIGSGSGAFTRRLCEAGFKVTASGIDPDDYRYTGAEFRLLDLAMPIDAVSRGAFDAAVAIEVIEHVENIFLFLSNVADLLAPQGVLLITTPNVVSLFSRLLFFKSGRVAFCNEVLMESWGHIQVLPEWYLRKAAAKVALDCLESRGVGAPRFDLAPSWHKWIDRLVPFFGLFLRQDFEDALKGSNLLMIFQKRQSC